ncbi:MAG: hypothetical protein LBV69_02495 [Bacteroidales bacterium]|jgi:hypothetical protein|nr:hypothetical protein [Bacteroidales bacterium]
MKKTEKKLFEMNLLNSETLKNVNGGLGDNCSKQGDTIISIMGVTVKLCLTIEATCPATSQFSSSNCTVFGGVTIHCPQNFKINV